LTVLKNIFILINNSSFFQILMCNKNTRMYKEQRKPQKLL